jgi:hypothetical protein
MCLDLNKPIMLLTAEEDIVCYKWVQKIRKIMQTPYRNSSVEFGIIYVSDLMRNKNGTVDIGLHSYAGVIALDELFYVHRFYPTTNTPTPWVVKCIIPKGAKYYVGIFAGEKSYASTELKYIERLKEEDYFNLLLEEKKAKGIDSIEVYSEATLESRRVSTYQEYLDFKNN